MKRVFLCLAGLSLIIGVLVVSEVFFRWKDLRDRPTETRACRKASPELHHELVPGSICRSKYREWNTTFAVNSLGFRDEEVVIPKPKNEYRILLLGDSFVEGESVEVYQTAAWLLEKKLRETLNQPVDVIDMGVMSYSAIQYDRLLKKWILLLRPDFVIVAVDMSDFQNDYSYSKDLDEQGKFRNILFQQRMGTPHIALPIVDVSIKFWLRTHSALYTAVADRIKQLERKVRKLPEPTVFQINDPASDPHFATRSEENARDPLMWDQFGTSLTNINTFLKSQRIPWVAVTYPYGHQAAPDEWAIGRVRNGFQSGVVYPATAAELLVRFGQEHGFNAVNLVPAFREAEKTRKEFLYYPWDGHFTSSGHQVFAGLLEGVVHDYAPLARL